MKRVMYLALASILFLPLSAAGQPAGEESISVWADTLDATNQMDLVVYTVPPGKQLIIDYVSMRTSVPTGEQVLSAAMNVPHVHFFTVTTQGSASNRTTFSSAQQTRIVVDANQTIVFRVERNNHGTSGHVAVSLAGRLLTKK